MSTAQYASMTPEQAAQFMPDAPPQLARKRLAELVGIRSVLDIGCSRAEEIGDLYQPAQYLGIDCSPALVAIARERWPEYQFEVCPAQEIEGHWPVAIMKAVLEHVPPVEALTIYNHVRAHVGVLYLCWHWEPSVEQKLTTYESVLGKMQQNRHDRAMFQGVRQREVVENHVIWTVDGV